MRRISFIIFLLLGASAELQATPQHHMLGGVDVGNGGRVVAGMVEGFFESEDQLVFQIKSTLSEVRRGEHPRVRQWITQGKCKFAMEYDSTDVITSYRRINGQWTKGVLGYTKILLDKCKDPYAIDADEHPAEESETQTDDWSSSAPKGGER